MTSPPELLVRAIQSLASVCDGAHEQDGRGFSANHAHFGRALADTPSETWNDGVTRKAWEVCGHYQAQLSRQGISWADIPEPPAVALDDSRSVALEGTSLVVRFRYSPELVMSVKSLPGARWDASRRAWTVHVSERAYRWAMDNGFLLTADATQAIQSPPEPPPSGLADAADGWITLAFGYDAALVAAVKALPQRKWDQQARLWKVPIDQIREVRAFVEAHGFTTSAAFDDLPDAEPDNRPGIALAGGRFTIRFPYDRDTIAAVRDLPGAAWSRALWAWTVPLDAAVEVAQFAETSGASIDDTASTVMDSARQALARIAESTAQDSTFTVHGLGGELMPFQRAGVAYILRAMNLLPEGLE